MIRARDHAGKQVSIGYQWSFSEAIGELKADVAAGLFGEPLRFKTLNGIIESSGMASLNLPEVSILRRPEGTGLYSNRSTKF